MSVLVVDGNRFSGSFDDAEKKVKYFVYTKKSFDLDEVHGFTTEQKILDWAKQENLLDVTKKGLEYSKKAEKRAESKPTPKEEDELRRIQVSKINLDRKRLLYELKKRGIKPTEAEKIQELVKDHDVILGPIGSCTIYDRRCVGAWRFLLGGHYPKFSWFGFNDKTEAIRVWWGLTILCQHTWWRGAQRWYYGPMSYCNLGWFNNRASSAIVL